MTQELKVTALALPDEAKFRQDIRAINRFQQVVHQTMVEGLDYGVIPGTGGKATLLKPGAEKIVKLLGLADQYEIVDKQEDWDVGFFRYIVRCKLTYISSGLLVSEGLGECNSKESKYHWRWVFPDDVPEYLDRLKLVKRVNRRRDGKGTFTQYRLENEDIYSLVNTILKMAKKRCLGSTTPLIVKTDRNILRTNASHLYSIMLKANKPVYLPSPDGNWKQIKGMNREVNREIYRIDLADGSYIRATSEHRFPTKRGLLPVQDIIIGDILLRSPLSDTSNGHRVGADKDIGWVVGLYLAEAYPITSKGIRFTLHEDETEFSDRVRTVAEKLGSHVFTTKRNGNNKTMDVCVYGSAFHGLMQQFVIGDNSRQKHLSLYSWSQGKEFLSQILDGYLAGDGHLLKKITVGDHYIVGFTGRNHELAHDLRAIGTLCDKRILIKSATSKCDGKIFSTYSGWVKPNIATYNQKCLEEIVNIQKENKLAIVYDIEVDGDHIFCLSNGIQTHNSLVDAALSSGSLSDIFTQDIEDMADIPAFEVVSKELPGTAAREQAMEQVVTLDAPESTELKDRGSEVEESSNPPAGEIEGIDMAWVMDSMKRTRFPLPTLTSWLRSKANYTGLDTTGEIRSIVRRMNKEQKEFLVKELEDRMAMR